MKKIISVMLVFVMAFAMLLPASASVQSADDKLQFNADGSFRIMQIADIQDGTIITPATQKFIKDAVEFAKPDLVVLTGDNISAGGSTVGIKAIDLALVESAINNVMSVLEDAGVPVAVVFGNHDAEQLVTKEEQTAIYQKYDNCLIIDDGANIYGCGTYNVPIYSSKDASKIAYNLWMFDSNMYDEENGGYDYVHQNQIDWYVNKSNELKAQNGGEAVPSMMFQHIIVNEIYDALLEVPAKGENTIERNGKYYTFNPKNTKSGTALNEAPCPSTVNGGQFDAVVNQGDVVAMCFGHDHVNSFVVEHKGVDLINTPGAGFGSYGDENRGVRLIDIKEGTTDYETSIVKYLELYADNDSMLEQYVLYGNEFSAIEKIAAFFKIIWIGISSVFSF